MKKRGFTLIELMVVIGIIVLLIGILLPVMSSVRKSATNATTTALLNHLRDNIDGYYTTFSAYPGPAPASLTAGGGGQAKQLSGAQNLLLGLSYALVDSTTPAGAMGPFSVKYPGPGNYKVDPTAPNGPLNYAQISPMTGKPEQLGAFFDGTTGRLSKPLANGSNWPPAGVVGAAGSNSFAFPVIVDTFGDALPILYYRRTPGVEKLPSPNDPTSNTAAAFYWNDNSEYTSSATLTATSGTVCPQTGVIYKGTRMDSRLSNANTGADELGRINGGIAAFNSPSNLDTNMPMRGGYMLISAGADRMYGIPRFTTTVSGSLQNPRDDIIVIGGH